MTAWWAKKNDDFSRDLPSVGREDLQLIGDNQFVVGVPWNFPEDFKRYVFAGAKAYCMSNRSIDYTMRTHGEHWKILIWMSTRSFFLILQLQLGVKSYLCWII